MWFINSFALSRCSWVFITFQCDGNSAFLHVTKTQLAKIGKIVLKSFLHIFYFPIILGMLHFCQTSLVIAVYPILRLWKPKCNLQLLNLSLYLQWHLFFYALFIELLFYSFGSTCCAYSHNGQDTFHKFLQIILENFLSLLRPVSYPELNSVSPTR